MHHIKSFCVLYVVLFNKRFILNKIFLLLNLFHEKGLAIIIVIIIITSKTGRFVSRSYLINEESDQMDVKANHGKCARPSDGCWRLFERRRSRRNSIFTKGLSPR